MNEPTAEAALSSPRSAQRAHASGTLWSKSNKAFWRRWLAITLVLGAVMGVAWFVLAPGGAIYGDGSDYDSWFPRDAALALLMLVAGVVASVLLLRQGRKTPRIWTTAAPTLALLVGALAGSVLAWRTGVFAGDLFHTLPENLGNPSIVFSLRSPSVLLIWPLTSAAVLFLTHLFGYYFGKPEKREEMEQGEEQ
ncbi:hypothetical protein [Arthrobacter sp. lap29]|uniref:hypothetical protein n=1 Tax=Arthrobacter sp. lap29 TaxID=3056122 RepID=UPI0028F70CA8|nr:hypothetical protein [Arthrobacter sp. lap29]